MGFYLAPMAEISTAAFRKMCYLGGADVCYTEMISAKAVMFGNKKTLKMAMVEPDEPKTFVQIFGSEPEDIAAAIRRIEEVCPPYGFDLNMGCPMKKVIKGRNGAFLLTDPDKVRRIVRAARAATKRPLSVKIRKGYLKDNCAEIAAIAEEEGADLLVVHPRLKSDMFLPGTCDFNLSIRIATERHIPVIHSGDITSPSDLVRFAGSRIAGVMIGRGAFGRPWVFEMMKTGQEPAPERKKDLITLHFNLIRLYSSRRSLKAMRYELTRNAFWDSRGMAGATEFRNSLYQRKWKPEELLVEIARFLGVTLS